MLGVVGSGLLKAVRTEAGLRDYAEATMSTKRLVLKNSYMYYANAILATVLIRLLSRLL